jgi:hypothetical protein
LIVKRARVWFENELLVAKEESSRSDGSSSQ